MRPYRSGSNGAVLHEGPSLIDGEPVKAIVIGLSRPSANTKTGPMLQTFIMRADKAPWAAVHDGSDFSVCGDCPARGRVVDGSCKERFCYVNVAKGCGSVFKAMDRGSYDAPADLAYEFGRIRPTRIGSYGEPTAVPFETWAPFIESPVRTGYTHRWRVVDGTWASLLMASVDTPEDRAEAKDAGWRTFRMRLASDPLLKGEIVCPASEEAGYRKTCERCGLCNGGDRGPDVAIIAHGVHAKSYQRWREAV